MSGLLGGVSTTLADLVASVIAGLLWDRYGASWTFIAGAAFSVLTLLALLAGRR